MRWKRTMRLKTGGRHEAVTQADSARLHPVYALAVCAGL